MKARVGASQILLKVIDGVCELKVHELLPSQSGFTATTPLGTPQRNGMSTTVFCSHQLGLRGRRRIRSIIYTFCVRQTLLHHLRCSMELWTSLSKFFSIIYILLLMYPCRRAEENGIWAWDCVLNESVLVMPVVLALLGDNPMQSEFACHIGLRGKLFCRACWVAGGKAGKDLSAPAGSDAGGTVDMSSAGSEDDHEEAHSIASQTSIASGNSAVPDKTTTPQKKSRRRKVLETFEQMRDRITAFIKVCSVPSL